MSAAPPRRVAHGGVASDRPGLTEPRWVRVLLTAIVVLFLGAFLLLPLAVVFGTAFSAGVKVYVAALTDPDARSAIRMTLIAAGSSVVLNTVFGVAAAWAVTRFRFPGKALLMSLIDLPFAVSPVIAGLVFVLLFGRQGWAAGEPVHRLWPIAWWALVVGGGWLVASALWRLARPRRSARRASLPSAGFARWWAIARDRRGAVRSIVGVVLLAAAAIGRLTVDPWLAAGNDLQVIFATPGIVLATVFVTFPFVARELIPVMQSVGQEEEQAALSLGASGWTTFRRVTLPNVKWGLLYGMILCNARAMGEYGAVNVVSGSVRGRTDTMPLHIENLFNGFGDHHLAAAFAVSSLLALLALVTLIIKTWLEGRIAHPPARV